MLYRACLKEASNRILIMEESQQEVYPDLSRWAIDVLSIPAMSDALEGLFSRAANTLHEGRAQLSPETVEALESIMSWSLQGIGTDRQGS